MALLGNAAVAIWSDMRDPAAHDHWHSHEHLLERLGIPGFLRARRMVTTEPGALRYFVLYEVADTSVMTSTEYLRCLNNPSDWTKRIMPDNFALNRTLCTVAVSQGPGLGSLMLAIPMAAQPGRDAQLRSFLEQQLKPSLATLPGVTGAHLLVRDAGIDRPRTKEEHLRGRPDGSVETLLLLEGYDAGALRELARTLLPNEARSELCRAIEPAEGTYLLAHTMASGDLR